MAGESIFSPNALDNAASVSPRPSRSAGLRERAEGGGAGGADSEGAGQCVEMSAVAAKNVALMVARDLGLLPRSLRPASPPSVPNHEL